MNEEDLMAQIKESNRINAENSRINSELLTRLNEIDKKKKEEEEENMRQNVEREKLKKAQEDRTREETEKELLKKKADLEEKEKDLQIRENDVFMMAADLKGFVEMTPYDKMVMWYEGQKKSSRDVSHPNMKMVSEMIASRKNEAKSESERGAAFGKSEENKNEGEQQAKSVGGAEMFPNGMFNG